MDRRQFLKIVGALSVSLTLDINAATHSKTHYLIYPKCLQGSGLMEKLITPECRGIYCSYLPYKMKGTVKYYSLWKFPINPDIKLLSEKPTVANKKRQAAMLEQIEIMWVTYEL